MAKVQFNTLGCKFQEEIKNIEFNGKTIEVKQYLPIQEKLGMIGRIISYAHEQDGNYSNPVKVDVITALEFVFVYTNISFTKNQINDMGKLYDALDSCGLIDVIMQNIPLKERNTIQQGVLRTIDSFYAYQNSFVGVIDAVAKNKNEVDFNIEEIKKQLNEIKDPEALNLLKELNSLVE